MEFNETKAKTKLNVIEFMLKNYKILRNKEIHWNQEENHNTAQARYEKRGKSDLQHAMNFSPFHFSHKTCYIIFSELFLLYSVDDHHHHRLLITTMKLKVFLEQNQTFEGL